MSRTLIVGTLIIAFAVLFSAGQVAAQTADQLVRGATDTGNVLNYGMGYNLQRYSPLTQINKTTVNRLVPVWNYSFDDDRSEESQPLVYRGVIYVTTAAATMAVDAKTGKQIWKTKVEYPPETPRVVCCGINNRGAALYDGKLFRTTLDANVVALDAATGKELWRQKVTDFKNGYAETVAPLVADGVVITGISGAEYNTRDFIDGWDAESGKHLWRTYTVPGPGEPGHDTWSGDSWQHGGGSTWITGSFDPQLHTVYWGVGNPGPFYEPDRKGDLLYTCSVLALDPKTGKIKWYYQFTPNNPFDYDSVAEMVLADMKVNGTIRKVLMDANRNGFFYILDRTNGHLLAANPYVKVNWASGIDMKTGRPIETDITTRARVGQKVVVWPSELGGKNWEPMSYDPKRGLAYANTLNIGARFTPVAEECQRGEMCLGIDKSDIWEWPDGPRGYLKAIDPLTGKAKWEAPSDIPRFSGVLSTAGGVVFSGRLTGEFEAFDADTGAKLWQFQTGSGIEGQPVTAAGWRAIHRRNKRYRRRLLNLLRRRALGEGAARRLAVGVCAAPVKPARDCMRQAVMALAVVGAVTSVPAIANETAPPADTIAQIQQGRALYVRHCAQCHGINMVTPGTVAFDLRTFPHDAEARFVDSVTHGKNNRMPAWGDVLSPQQIDELWAYIRSGGRS